MTNSELSGLLAEDLVIQRRAAGRAATGVADGDWQEVAQVAAAVVPQAGGPRSRGDARRSLARWRVTVRSGVPVRLSDRLAWRGQVLTIVAIVRDPRMPDRVEIECEGDGT